MGDGPPCRGQLGKAPGQAENGAVLVQQGVVFQPGDAAAAGGENDAGALALLRQDLRFQGPEAIFPRLGEDLRNGHARFFGNEGVGLHHLPAQVPAQGGGHGGLAAAGHTDEDDVPQMAVDGALHPFQNAVVDDGAGELLAGTLGLGHQHGKAAGVGDPQFLRLKDQGRPGGVIDDVQHPLAVGKLPEVHRCGPVAGVHAHRGGVGDDPGVGVAVQVIVVVGAAAGDDGDAGPQLFQGGLYRDGSAAAAQHQGLFPGGVNAAAADHVEKAVKVCVVAVEGAVRAADDGVDALQLGRRL